MLLNIAFHSLVVACLLLLTLAPGIITAAEVNASMGAPELPILSEPNQTTDIIEITRVQASGNSKLIEWSVDKTEQQSKTGEAQKPAELKEQIMAREAQKPAELKEPNLQVMAFSKEVRIIGVKSFLNSPSVVTDTGSDNPLLLIREVPLKGPMPKTYLE